MDKIVIYQILTRLFANTTGVNVPNGTLAQNGCAKFSYFTPRMLAEIKKLATTHVWYTGILEHATQTDYTRYGIDNDHAGIVKGKAGSPYAVRDYYDVDPDLADNPANRMQEFEKLVARTHKAGLKMIIDFVPNHVARQYHSDVKPETAPIGTSRRKTISTITRTRRLHRSSMCKATASVRPRPPATTVFRRHRATTIGMKPSN